ncbi:MAG: hypothetical protein EXS08_05610 [Planctomycetes bacterium]|nr:hypothetical protein [Planctomycetota bacterium]
MPSPTLPLLALLSFFFSVGGGDGTWTVALKPEEAGGYAANPSTLSLPLRQDLSAVRLARSGAQHTLELVGAAAPLGLSALDLSLLVPSVPAYARHDDDLSRFALLQREFNRNEVKFGPQGELADFKVANNCLKSGLWEVMLDKKVESGNAMTFHGWFEFPRDEYARVFEQLNGRSFQECQRLLAEYPQITGMNAPLAALRKVTSEHEMALQSFPAEAPIRFGEQKRKAKLVLTSGIATYADFTAKANQPIRTARFSEPGFYDPSNPVSFDLGWLAQPTKATRREVELVQAAQSGGQKATEIELAFANGLRIVLADRDLGALPPRAQAPDNDKDTLRLTFGIGTPDIFATLAERSSELSAERPNWLFLLGADGKHVDNHQTGIDRVFCWNEDGRLLHLYLVGYERIAVVAHLTVALTSN